MAISDLHIALIGAGIAAVAAVWAYNLWQERKARRSAEAIFRREHGDTLLAGAADTQQRIDNAGREPAERIEPVFSADDPGRLAASPDDSAADAEPLIDASVTAAEEHSELPAQPADVLTDCVLRLTTAEPVPAPAVWVTQASWAAELDKPLHWLAHDEATDTWVPLDGSATGRYVQWIASLQLADRRGAISEGSLAHFFDGVQQVADEVGAVLELPATGQVAAHAAALDEFCASVDIQFKLHIVEAAGGVFSGTKLRGVAEAAGLALEDDGRFHARDASGDELFTLTNLGSEGFSIETLRSLATHGLTLSIDVPRVSDGPATFTRMLGAGQQLARALGGVLVDAQRAPLAEDMIAAIRAKIIELQQTMRDAGIDPGSTRALRLFS